MMKRFLDLIEKETLQRLEAIKKAFVLQLVEYLNKLRKRNVDYPVTKLPLEQLWTV